MARFKAPFSYVNAQTLGIASSLAIHAFFLTLLLLISIAKWTTIQQTIQISLVQQDSSSTIETREVPKPSASKPALQQKKSNPQKKEKAVSQPEKLSLESDKQSSQNRPVPSVAVSSAKLPERSSLTAEEIRTSSSTASSEIESAGKAAPVQGTTGNKGEKAGAQSTVETSFGTTGAPAFINRVFPVYPPLARRLGKEGRVLLKLHIDRHGKLRDIEVLESAGFGLLEAAIAAAKQSTYSPAIRDGEAIASKAILPVRFSLDK